METGCKQDYAASTLAMLIGVGCGKVAAQTTDGRFSFASVGEQIYPNSPQRVADGVAFRSYSSHSIMDGQSCYDLCRSYFSIIRQAVTRTTRLSRLGERYEPQTDNSERVALHDQ